MGWPVQAWLYRQDQRRSIRRVPFVLVGGSSTSAVGWLASPVLARVPAVRDGAPT